MKCKLCAILAWYIWECIFCAPWRTRDNSAFWQVKTLSYWDCICLSHVRSFLFFLPWASWLQSLPSSQEYTLIYSHFNPWLHYVLLNIEFFLLQWSVNEETDSIFSPADSLIVPVTSPKSLVSQLIWNATLSVCFVDSCAASEFVFCSINRFACS